MNQTKIELWPRDNKSYKEKGLIKATYFTFNIVYDIHQDLLIKKIVVSCIVFYHEQISVSKYLHTSYFDTL